MMQLWALSLLLLSFVVVIQCGCPCVEGGTCQIPYGRHPLDILYFGIHPHCEDVRKVRCCDRSGIRAYFVTDEEDLFNPKLTPKLEQTRECGCIPKGACQPLNVVPDPSCTGTFEKCCLPRNQLIQLSPAKSKRRSKAVVPKKPTPVYDPYESKARTKKEIVFDSIVTCVPLQECQHVFKDENHIWKELGITQDCPQEDHVRCIHNDTNIRNTFPDDQEIEGILKTFGITPQAPGFHLEPDGTLVIHGGSPIVVVDAADPTAKEPLILTDHDVHPSQLEYFNHVADNGTFVPDFDRIAKILDALSANQSHPYEVEKQVDYQDVPESKNVTDDEFFNDVFAKLFGDQETTSTTTTLQPYFEVHTEPYVDHVTEYYEDPTTEALVDHQPEIYVEDQTETYEGLSTDFHVEPHMEPPLDPIDYEVINYVDEIQKLLKSDEAARRENQEVVEEFVTKMKNVIYFILESEDTEIRLSRGNNDKIQKYEVSKSNALELLKILNSFQKTHK